MQAHYNNKYIHRYIIYVSSAGVGVVTILHNTNGLAVGFPDPPPRLPNMTLCLRAFVSYYSYCLVDLRTSSWRTGFSTDYHTQLLLLLLLLYS